MSDAPTMRPYGRHILICENGDCADSEAAAALQRRFAELARAHGLNKLRNPERVKCTLTGCLGVCGGGPILVVYPDGIWYHHVDADALERIVNEHILDDRPVADLIFQQPEVLVDLPDANRQRQCERQREDRGAATARRVKPEPRRHPVAGASIC